MGGCGGDEGGSHGCGMVAVVAESDGGGKGAWRRVVTPSDIQHSAACSDLRVLQIGIRAKVIENQTDPEEDPEEYEDDETEDGPVDYPMDGGDNGDDDDGDSSGNDADGEDEDEEDEEHIAPADSTIVAPVDESVFPPEGNRAIYTTPSTDITIGDRIYRLPRLP
ncbi:hypothetical protein Tco_1450056 [Tanacetum coccineum]